MVHGIIWMYSTEFPLTTLPLASGEVLQDYLKYVAELVGLCFLIIVGKVHKNICSNAPEFV